MTRDIASPSDADLMTALNRKAAELGSAAQINLILGRYAPPGSHPKQIPMEKRAAFLAEVLALRRKKQTDPVGPDVSPRHTRLVEAAVDMAIRFAEERHPIMQRGQMPPYALDEIARRVGWRPTKGQVIEACWEAVPERLVYHQVHSNTKYRTGFYPAPGPGGKGFD